MTQLRFFGDSHVDIFAAHGPDRWLNDGLVFTLDRLRQWHTVYRGLDLWLESCRGSSVVLSAGNTDIRAHWWRRSLRSGYRSISAYVQDQAQEFLAVTDRIRDRYQLARLIILGPPVCADHIWDGHYPYSGSVATRNRMVDLWNQAVVNQIRAYPSLSFCTAFYHYLDLDTWRAHSSVMDDDGVHYAWSQRTYLLDQVIGACDRGSDQVHVPNMDIMTALGSRSYQIEWTAWREQVEGYWDAWIFSESQTVSETYARRSTDPNSRDYELDAVLPRPSTQWGTLRAQYVFFDELSAAHCPYKELVLVG